MMIELEISSSSEPDSDLNKCKLETLSQPEDIHHVHASPSRFLPCRSRPNWNPDNGIPPIHTYRMRALSDEEIKEEEDNRRKRRRM